MPETLEGFPFWALHFDDQGRLLQPDAAAFVKDVAAAGLTDLFVFSHGWNNNEASAMQLYHGFFGEVRKILDDAKVPKQPGIVAGVAGVIWPSILFPGDPAPGAAPAASGGAASFDPATSTATLETELPKIFPTPAQAPHLDHVLQLLRDQQPDNESLFAFRDALSKLMQSGNSENTTTQGQENLELQATTVASDDDWLQMLDVFSVQSAGGDPSDGGGAADFGSAFGKLWDGAKNVLRIGTFWQMKNRAGVVGKTGLSALLSELHQASGMLRIHLLGHSFGARLVSYTLSGLPAPSTGGASPVKSVMLMQGAFSHFAFADALPFDKNRKGDLAGMAGRVDGPLLATHTLKDLAVGNAYPAASVVAREDASAADDAMYRWEGIGHDGAQCVGAQEVALGAAGTRYDFKPGQWINLDANLVIVSGGPPAGAHGDIIHPETAWALLAAAKLV